MKKKSKKKLNSLVADRVLVLICTVLVIISTAIIFNITKQDSEAAGGKDNLGVTDTDVVYGSLQSIEAEYNVRDIYAGTYLNENSVKVYGVYENGGRKLLNGWSSDMGILKEGENSFNIEYKQFSTTLVVTAESMDTITEVKDYVTYDFEGSVAEIIVGEVMEGNVTFDDVYSDVVMCGDSRTLAISTFKVLSADKILAKNGVGLDHLEDYIQKLLSKNPKTVILNYGVNSISEYENGRIELVERYEANIKQLQSMLPDTRIIVAAVFPVMEYFAAEQPRMNYIEDLNLKLLKMCIENNVEFVDSTQVLDRNSYLYNPDGLHFDEEFYREFWLLDLISTAGIGVVTVQ